MSTFQLNRLTFITSMLFSMLWSLGFSQASTGTSKEEEKIIREAEREWRTGHFQKSFELYKQAVAINPTNRYTNFRVGEIYFLSDSAKIKSLPYLRNVIKYSPAEPNDTAIIADYYLGYCYMLKEQYDSAALCFETFKSHLVDDKVNQPAFAEIEQNLKICYTAPRILKRSPDSVAYLINGKLKQRLSVSNMGDSINSKYPDYAQILFDADKTILFTSRHPTKEDPKANYETGKYQEDIYESKKDKNGFWSTPVLYSDQLHLNTKRVHTATDYMTSNGDTLYTYTRGGILESKNTNGTWSQPQKLTTENNLIKNWYVPSVFISNDSKKMLLVSDRKGGYGGRDIYMCTRDSSGKWSEPENLGSVINTPEDEDAPFLMPDNKTLFFSSKGHGGLGGYDIFVSHYDSATGTWSTPQNLGAPINSPADDIYFSYKNNKGYFSSSRVGGYGDLDIYSFSITNNVPAPKVIAQADTTSKSKTNANAETTGTTETTRTATSSAVVSCVVYFKFGKYNLLKKYEPSLDSIVTVMKANKDMKLQVNGYTCSIGSVKYNKLLSEWRASTVAKYLINHGVKSNRIVYRGFGKTDFVAPNDGVHNYLNRRVQVVNSAK